MSREELADLALRLIEEIDAANGLIHNGFSASERIRRAQRWAVLERPRLQAIVNGDTAKVDGSEGRGATP